MSSFKRVICAAAPAGLAAALMCGAVLAAPAPAPAQPAAAPAPAPAAADWRQLSPEDLLVIDTTKGRIVIELRPELAPEHVAQIKTLTRQGYYDGLQFFRVLDQFMAQTGDKDNTGAGDAAGVPLLKGTFNFRRGSDVAFAPSGKAGSVDFGFIGGTPVYSQPEALALMTIDGKLKSWAAFCPGVAGMARTQNPDSASTQFFIMRGHTAMLEDQYTAWGRVVVGQDVVDALQVGEPPANPDLMNKVRIAADMPPGERPNVSRVDPASASFQAAVTAARAAKGASFSPCDVQPATRTS